ncbi:hypothetical protein, partial [Xanthomonas citri]|uniref:hypothetical protein n=1 Tax=Xanthomonas citri TaxID=346 RepID=UPI001FEFADDD
CFGYRLWAADFLPQLAQQAAQIARRDVTPSFVAAELSVGGSPYTPDRAPGRRQRRRRDL